MEAAGKRRKIAIVGKAPSSFRLAPFKDESWEIWVLNDLVQQSGIDRWDRHFDLHDLSIHRETESLHAYFKWMQEQSAERPIYLRETHPDIPAGVRYPFEEICQQFNLLYDERGKLYDKPYITNSISWMIALALHEGAEEIGLYGVDMAQHGIGIKSEYAAQRPSCELFVGIALGMGVKVTIPRTADLCKTRRLYALDDPGQFESKLRVRADELRIRHDEAEAAADEAKGRGYMAIGALQEINTLRSMTNGEVAPVLQEREKLVREALDKASKETSEAERLKWIFFGAKDDVAYFNEWV